MADQAIEASPPVLMEWKDVDDYRAALSDRDMHAIAIAECWRS